MMETAYTYEGHKSQKIKGLPWPYCPGCGLVFLKNPITRWCVKTGCNFDEHPDYEKTLEKLTKG